MPRLTDPMEVAGQQIANRLVMPPMVTNLASPRGEVTDRLLRHYERRAAAGVGMIIVEASVVDWDFRLQENNLGVHHDELIPGLTRLARRIKAHGALALIQLVHAGSKSMAPRRLVGPSAVRVLRGPLPEVLDVGEIAAAGQQFVTAARRAKEAGFDGVELHCGHLYLLSAFLSPYTNRRRDLYGGSTENRARLVTEILGALPGNGDGLLVCCRINGMENIRGGVDIHEAVRVAGALQGAGADLLHVSGVISRNAKSPIPHYQPEELALFTRETRPDLLRGFPFGSHLPCAGFIKKAVDVPVIGVGKVRDAVVARDALDRGLCDLVAVGRGMLADPLFAHKALAGQHEAVDSCQQCGTCLGRVVELKPIRCSVNAALGDE